MPEMEYCYLTFENLYPNDPYVDFAFAKQVIAGLISYTMYTCALVECFICEPPDGGLGQGLKTLSPPRLTI